MTRQKKALAKVTFDQAALKLARSKKESQKKSLETLKTSYQESQSEAVNLATIQKIPHTVRYLGSSTISPFVHAVKMECLPPDLISIIKKRGAGLSIKETQAVAKAGFEFILNMGKNSFIHKDIKPQNIAFDEKTLSVKFFDFESLAVDQQPHRDKTTLKFRPPEFLIQKEVHVTYDIWSFGVTLHLCYTGKPLFKWINNQGMHPGSHLVKNDIVAAVISLVGLPGDESLKSKAAQTYFKLTEQGYKLKTSPSSNVILPTWRTVEADLLKAAKMKKEPKSQALLLLDLLKKMLVLVDSTPERIMPQKALKHPFIKHKKEERKESR
jgi:serine/threonine protein kinase